MRRRNSRKFIDDERLDLLDLNSLEPSKPHNPLPPKPPSHPSFNNQPHAIPLKSHHREQASRYVDRHSAEDYPRYGEDCGEILKEGVSW